jgi:uridylate kinase
MAKKEIKVISLGGSIIIPKTGFDTGFLKKLKALIVRRVKKGDRFILIIGGGATCRQYQKAARAIVSASDYDLDNLGIAATHFNAHFVRLLFGNLAYNDVVVNPTKKIKTSRPIIVAGGWKPGCSTDKDAVLLAKTYGAGEMINASNINYIYTADPNKDPHAKPILKMTWPEMKKLIGDKWRPGANLPFDPSAAKEARKLKMKIYFVRGTNLIELEKAIEGKRINGTIVE